MGNKQSQMTARHKSTQVSQRELQSQQHNEAMAKISLESARIEARAREAQIAMEAEKNRLEAAAKQAQIQMEKEKAEREAELKQQEMINKENDKTKKREQRQEAIDNINTKLTQLPDKIKNERDKLKMVKEELGETTEKLNEVNAKLENWDEYKNQELTVYKLEVENAKDKYDRDDKAIKDAVHTTGVHEQNVGKFLVYTHNLINATVSTRASTNKLQTKISTFGELIQRLCQYKLSIEGYFTDNEPKLKPFVPILAAKNITYLNELKCKNEDEFEKDILPLLERGIIAQQKNEKNEQQTEEKKEEKNEEKQEKSGKELLTEWGLQKFINAFEEDGWDDPQDWNDINDDELKELNLGRGHIKKFRRCYNKWSKGAALSEDDELIGFMQKRILRSICLESETTWEKDAKIKAKQVKMGLMIASPLLGGFFAKIDIAVKQAQHVLEYPDNLNDNKPTLNETQLKAIEMISDDEKKNIDDDDDDNNNNNKVIRQKWGAQSKCKIFSESDQKWYDGTIIKITNDKEGEWLNVAYRTGDKKVETLKQIQRFAKEIKAIKPIQDDIKDDIKDDEDSKILKTECRSLTQAAIVDFHIVESLQAECKGDSVKLMALNVADGVEKGCVQIFKSQGIIRQSVILAQNILQLKPANMEDKTRKELWKSVDNGIVNIFNTAIEVVKVSEKYFNFFLRFKQSFGYFIQCYHNKNEQQQEEISLVVSMEYLQKDIREFDAFQKNFVQIVNNLEQKSMNVIEECVKTAIGAEEFEKSRNSRKKTKEIYLEKQKQYDNKLAKLDQALDDYWDTKIVLSAKFSTLQYQQDMLSKSIEDNEKYYDSLEKRLENIQKIQI